MVTSRAVVLVLRKKELKHEYWTRLTKEKPNRNFVKCDFSKVSCLESAWRQRKADIIVG
jgi:hypothetical protein